MIMRILLRSDNSNPGYWRFGQSLLDQCTLPRYDSFL